MEHKVINAINYNLLSIFGNDVSILKKIIESEKIILTGSSLISYVLDRKWENSEIILCMHIENLENTFDFEKPNLVAFMDTFFKNQNIKKITRKSG